MDAMQDVIRVHCFGCGALKVNYRKPVPIDRPVELRARLAEFAEKKVTVRCDVLTGGAVAADAEVLAVRVPAGPRT